MDSVCEIWVHKFLENQGRSGPLTLIVSSVSGGFRADGLFSIDNKLFICKNKTDRALYYRTGLKRGSIV